MFFIHGFMVASQVAAANRRSLSLLPFIGTAQSQAASRGWDQDAVAMEMNGGCCYRYHKMRARGSQGC